MSPRFISNFVKNMSSEDMSDMLSAIDIQSLMDDLGPAVDKQLQPHFSDIRERAAGNDAESVRRQYQSLPDEQQQKVFESTVADLIVVLRECRETPKTGLPKLKARMRDPDVVEPLLLIFENEDHIDPAYTDEMKELAASTLRWAGASVFPEMYTQDELDELQAELEHETA